MSIAGGLHLALERGEEAGCDVVQIFTKSNQQWAARPIDPPQREAWAKARHDTGVLPVLVHTSYLLNLATGDPRLWKASRDGLEEELERCALLDIPFLVLHPGSHVGAGVRRGIQHLGRGLNEVFASAPQVETRILIENTAGQGTSIGAQLSHFGDLMALLDEPRRVGMCLDTCHAFAAGYDIRAAQGWDALLEEVAGTVGLGSLCAFHVNDSKAPLGARVDRHDHIGRGHLGLESFRILLNDPRVNGRPMILETPKSYPKADETNLGILRSLAGRKRVGARARRLAEQHPSQ